MEAEINEQPAILRRLRADGSDAIGALSGELARRDIRFVLLAARGTSDHAALYAKYLAEVQLGLPAGLVSPSSMTVYGARPDLTGALFIAVSQSGGSPDLVESVATARAGGATTVAVTNNVGSELAAAAEFVVDIRAGLERAVAATKTYTAELLALYLLLMPLSPSEIDVGERSASLADAAEQTLAGVQDVATAAARYRFADRLITTARGYSYPTAREAALKLMETAYVGAHAFSGADLLHGPMAIVDTTVPVIAVVTPGAGGAAMQPVVTALRARNADLLVVCGGSVSADSDDGRQLTLRVADEGVPEELLPIVEILPLQQLALHLALSRGGDPDAPRGLNKVTSTW
ncbi:SIS domain-containing protein [Pseudonocardia acidicola]|uniref:SIS domain-containing protein n=1 Tax=Pseudonocardia acidicola TaxID=2724939 RepID=A0ABX1S742_9PSEU|nr:SIS domain-containing protein [Pseudonocardia acidicola]NMH97385.1 SIS domain-containing protein [Pseudonocardia acidicola]